MHGRSTYLALTLLAALTAALRLALLGTGLVYPPVDYGVYAGVGSYLLDARAIYSENIVGTYVEQGLPFVYTPFGALVLLPLSLLPEPLGLGLWTFLNAYALGLVLALCLRYALPGLSPRPFLLCLVALFALATLTSVGAQHFVFGQINMLLVALCLLDAVRPPHRYLPRGALIGIAAGIKLTPLLFVAFFYLTGRWAPALTSTLAGLVTLALGALALPRQTLDYFGSKLTGLSDIVDLGENFATSGNSSLQGVSERLLGTHSLPLLAPALLLLVAVIFWGAHRLCQRGDSFAAATLLGVGTCLLSPISWLHHWVWVFPALAVLVTRGRSYRVLAALWALVCLAHLTDLGDLAAGAGLWAPIAEIMRGSMVLGGILFVTLTSLHTLTRPQFAPPPAHLSIPTQEKSKT